MKIWQTTRFVAPRLATALLASGSALLQPGSAKGQIIPDNTLGSESSVLVPGDITDLIEGGATRGSALFHSFENFSINTGQQVYFANPVGIENILSRVTGFNPSQINGLLGVDGAANFFFINPNGIVFGPDAQLDVEGAFLASTSDRFRFADGSEFRATDPNAAPLVTVNIPLGLQLGPDAPEALVSEADLTAGTDLTLAAGSVTSTGILSAPNGMVHVEGISGNVRVQGIEAQSAVLSASENLVLEEGRLVTQGDLSLLAGQAVRIRDSEETAFLAAAGGDLLIRGDAEIDILALNHLEITPFQSGGNMTLASDGPISGDAHFFSWGNYSIEDLEGNPGDFFSYYDPIISVDGDVTFGNYTGVALKVEATGSIEVTGNIRITGPDTSLSNELGDLPIRGDVTLNSAATDPENLTSYRLTTDGEPSSGFQIEEFLDIDFSGGPEEEYSELFNNGTYELANDGAALRTTVFTILDDGDPDTNDNQDLELGWRFLTQENNNDFYRDFSFFVISDADENSIITVEELSDTTSVEAIQNADDNINQTIFDNDVASSRVFNLEPGEYRLGIGVMNLRDSFNESGLEILEASIGNQPLSLATTEADTDTLALINSPALILRAGVESVETSGIIVNPESANVVNESGNLTVTTNYDTVISPGAVDVTVTTTTSEPGLENVVETVTTTFSSPGGNPGNTGDLTVMGNLDTSSESGNAGPIILSAANDINIASGTQSVTVPSEELEDAQDDLNAAQANRNNAQTSLNTAQTNRNNAQTSLNTAQTNRNNAQTSLNTAQANRNNAQASLNTADETVNTVDSARAIAIAEEDIIEDAVDDLEEALDDNDSDDIMDAVDAINTSATNIANLAPESDDLDDAQGALTNALADLDSAISSDDDTAANNAATEAREAADDAVSALNQLLETAEDNLETAQDALEAAEDNLETAEDALETAQDNLETAEDALETAQNNLETAQDNLETAQDNLETAQDDFEIAESEATKVVAEPIVINASSSESDSTGGGITLQAGGTVSLSNTRLFNTAFGGSGDISLSGSSIVLSSDTTIDAGAVGPRGRSGNVFLEAEGNGTIEIDDSVITTAIAPGAAGESQTIGGNITLTGENIELRNGGFLNARTDGNAGGGNIVINPMDGGEIATGSVRLQNQSGILTSVGTRATENADGEETRGGNIQINTGSLALLEGSTLQTQNLSENPNTQAGDVELNISGSGDEALLISGQDNLLPGQDDLLNPSGILTFTEAPQGQQGGNIDVNVTNGTFVLRNGAVVNATNESTIAPGGSVTIEAGNLAIQSGSQIVASARGESEAGNITINTTNNVDISGARSTSTSGDTPDAFEASEVFNLAGFDGPSNTLIEDIELSDRFDHVSLSINNGFTNGSQAFAPGEIHLYSFIVSEPGSRGIFEVDDGFEFSTTGLDPSDIDTELYLWDRETGNLLATNDDFDISFGGTGSESRLDAYISYIFRTPGEYVLGVSRYTPDDPADFSTDTVTVLPTPDFSFDFDSSTVFFAPEPDASYTLQVTLESRADMVPDPQLFEVVDNAEGSLVRSGIFATAETGTAGNVTIDNATSVTVSEGGAISTSATQPGGTAQDVAINTVDLTVSGADSVIEATAETGTAGNVDVNAVSSVQLFDGGTITSATDSGTAGNVDVDASTVTVSSGAEIAASAETGTAGNVDVNANTVTVTGAGSEIEAIAGSGTAGNVTINEATSVAVSGGGVISTSATQPGGTAQSVTINTVDLIVSGTDSTVEAEANDGVAGSVDINAANSVQLSNGGTIQTSATASGIAGNVDVDASTVTVSSGAEIAASAETGTAGNVDVNANTVTVTGAGSEIEAIAGSGTAGNVTINEATSVAVSGGGVISTSATQPGGTAQSVTINTVDLIVSGTDSTVEADAIDGTAGNVDVNAGNLVQLSNGGKIQTSATASGIAGNVDVDASAVTVSSGAAIAASAEANTAGNVGINAETVTVTGTDSAIAATAETGTAGNVTINEATSVAVSEGGVISTSATQPGGTAQSVTINTVDLIVSGADSTVEAEANDGVAGDIEVNAASTVQLSEGGAIATNAIGDSGTAGDIRVQANTVAVTTGAAIAAEADGGIAGSVDVNANDSILISDGGEIQTSVGDGTAGSITAAANVITITDDGSSIAATAGNGTAGSVTLGAENRRLENLEVSDGGEISVSSDGIAGGLDIFADFTLLDRGFLTAETGATGGEDAARIRLNLDDVNALDNFLFLRNESRISATANGAANGGNIIVNTDFIIAEFPTGERGSDIVANAADGDGGEVTVNALAAFGIQVRPEETPLNDITATSERGVQGTAILNTLVTDPDSGLAELTFDFVDASDQRTDRCVAGSGEGSEITVSGRGGLPAMPTDILGATTADTEDWVTLESEPTQSMASAMAQAGQPTATARQNLDQQSLCHRAYRASQEGL